MLKQASVDAVTVEDVLKFDLPKESEDSESDGEKQKEKLLSTVLSLPNLSPEDRFLIQILGVEDPLSVQLVETASRLGHTASLANNEDLIDRGKVEYTQILISIEEWPKHPLS